MFRAPPFNRNRTRRPGLPRRFRARLWVEELESRTLLSVYTPVQISTAYGFSGISFNGTKGDGSGQTIAIVDAYWDPTIQSDLTAFNTQFGLPQLNGQGTNGTFVQTWVGAGQGVPKPSTSPSGDDWTLETALDVEWAHAMAPKANLVLMQAASDTSDSTGAPTDLLNAVDAAAKYSVTVNGKTSPVVAVSMSWGQGETANEINWDSHFNVPGVTFLAASGDSGAGTIWPAVSPYVVAVGGTSLKLTSSNTISSESGWGNGPYSWYFGGSGGGFSQYESLPTYQQNIPTVSNGFKLTSFGVRLSPDVAFDGDPNTGFYVLDGADGGWFQVGGTSAGAPQWAALVAIADQGRALNGLPALSSTQTLDALYGIYYGHNSTGYTKNFHDVTTGNSTGSYYVTNSSGQVIGQITVRPGSGYDLVTGIGSPVASVLAVSLAHAGQTGGPPLAATTGSSTTSSGSTSRSGSGGKAHPHALPAAVTSAAAALSGPGSPSGTQGGSGSLLGAQVGQVLSNGSALQGTRAPVAPAVPVSTPAPSAASAVGPLPPSRVSGPSSTLAIDSGGGDLLPPEGQPADDRASVPDARAVPAMPPAPQPQAPMPGLDNVVPDAAYPRDGAFVQGEVLPVIEPQQAALALSDTAGEAVSRLEPSFAMSGLAIALLWHWRGDTSAAAEDEGRRPGEQAA